MPLIKIISKDGLENEFDFLQTKTKSVYIRPGDIIFFINIYLHELLFRVEKNNLVLYYKETRYVIFSNIYEYLLKNKELQEKEYIELCFFQHTFFYNNLIIKEKKDLDSFIKNNSIPAPVYTQPHIDFLY